LTDTKLGEKKNSTLEYHSFLVTRVVGLTLTHRRGREFRGPKQSDRRLIVVRGFLRRGTVLGARASYGWAIGSKSVFKVELLGTPYFGKFWGKEHKF